MGNALKKIQVPCCEPGPPLGGRSGSQKGGSSLFGSSQKAGEGSHSIMRSGPLADGQSGGGPRLQEFILIPWLCAVVICLITMISAGGSAFWVVLPALVICGVSGTLAWEKYTNGVQPMAIFYVLVFIAGFAAFIMSLITYIHFLQPYYELGGGATYLDLLPSQSALGASDATAIVFAQGTSVDSSRTFGFVDGRNPEGTMYCVAPVSNAFTLREPGVQFFAAGVNCCGKRSGFGCGKGGTGRGAMILAREESADPGFKKAVEGAAAEYGLQPGNGYLLLTMVEDPMAFRSDKLDSAVKLLFIYIFVYFLISCMIGFMVHNLLK